MGMENGPGPGWEEIAKMEKPNSNQESPKADEAEKKEINQDQEKEQEPRIKFPENIETVRALQNKLVEYKNRLVLQKKKYPYRAPETFTDTNYKIAVLEKLLTDGEVDTYSLSRELNKEYRFIDAGAFENACAVINDYVQTGGKHVRRVRRS